MLLDKIQIKNLNVILENVYECMTGISVSKVDARMFHHETPYLNGLSVLRNGLLSRDEKRRRGMLKDNKTVYLDAEDNVFLATGEPDYDHKSNGDSYVPSPSNFNITIDNSKVKTMRRSFEERNWDNEVLSFDPVVLPETFKKLNVQFANMIKIVKDLNNNETMKNFNERNENNLKMFLKSSIGTTLSKEELFEKAKPLFKKIRFKLIDLNKDNINDYYLEIGNEFIELIKKDLPSLPKYPDYLGISIIGYVKEEMRINSMIINKYNYVIAAYNSLIDMAKYIKSSNLDIGIREVVDNQIVYDLNVEKLSTMKKM